MGDSFAKTIKEVVEKDKNDPFVKREERGKVKYYRDTYAEHPEDRENIEYCVQMEGDDALLTLTELYDQMKALGFNLGYFRYLNLSYLEYQIHFQEKVKKNQKCTEEF